MTPFNKRRLRFFVPVLILLAGLIIMTGLKMLRKPPARHASRHGGALVEVMTAEQTDRRVPIEGNGTVAPRYEVVLIPQVSGKIEWVDPGFVSGAWFRRGDPLLRIERSDYELAARRAEAEVAKAKYQIDVARANAAVARREWELMNLSRRGGNATSAAEGMEPDPLVLHEPQLRQAEANLLSAKTALETAGLNLRRTELCAPFDCRVRRQSASPGQLVGPASQIANLYATDIVEIDIGLAPLETEWIEIPGAPARVYVEGGGEGRVWDGYVDRSVGVLDEIGRLDRVVVRVKEPFRDLDEGKPALSIGSFVHVEIEGRLLESIIPIPRSAVREESTVWVVGAENRLEIREVTVKRFTSNEALLSNGLEPGDRIILTPLTGAAEGMSLRPVER